MAPVILRLSWFYSALVISARGETSTRQTSLGSGHITVSVTADWRVHVFHDGAWSYVCANQWDDQAAQVVCRMQGFWHGQGTAVLRDLQAENSVVMDNVQCYGNESSLVDCRFDGFSPQQCQIGRMAAVNCNATNPVSARLVEGFGPWEGRLELRDNDGTWRPVCQAGFDDDDAQVVCRMLGIRHHGGTAHTDEKFPQSVAPPIIEQLNCQGTESELVQCKGHEALAGANCSSAGVECYNCGGMRLEESGILQSEDFPSSYPGNQHCLYVIRPSNDQQLYKLKFDNFSTEACCDSLDIRVLTDSSNVPGGVRHAGNTLPAMLMGKAFALEFVTDGSRSFSGFSASWSPIYVEDLLSVRCEEGHLTVDIDFTSLKRLYPQSTATTIGLANPSCVGTVQSENGTGTERLVIKSDTDDCGTHVVTDVSTIHYDNFLVDRVFADSSRVIVRERRWQIPIHCTVVRTDNFQVHYNPVPELRKRESTPLSAKSVPEVHTSLSEGQAALGRGRREVQGSIRVELDFPITMTAYRDQNYTLPQTGDVNLSRHLGDVLYIRVALNGGDLGLKLVLQNCYAKPDQQINLTYYLIQHGCAVDANPEITDVQGHYTDFRLTAFEFAGDFPHVFLTCDVNVCPTNDTSAPCSQQCSHTLSSRRDLGSRGAINLGSRGAVGLVSRGAVSSGRRLASRLSLGPIMLEQ